jgi:mannitol/fructose-specific phosphotransferase system IIA component (Ntr-type)/predicted DNA-binding transcriptional regulator AlpA
MPYRTLDLAAAADYLHVTRSELEQLVKTTEIPHQDRGGRLVFLRGEIDAWASQRILGLTPKRLAAYHQKSTQGTSTVFAQEALLPNLLQFNFITATMLSKTKKSVIRDLVALAETTGKVMNPADLLASVEERESLCSTGLPGGIALLHCRNHQPYRFEDSFIVLGRTMQEIHFGAPDGRPTWLFFLICCQDERIHLHTLARLCLIVQQTDIVAQLLAAPDATTMYAALLAAEQTALTDKKRPSNQASTA